MDSEAPLSSTILLKMKPFDRLYRIMFYTPSNDKWAPWPAQGNPFWLTLSSTLSVQRGCTRLDQPARIVLHVLNKVPVEFSLITKTYHNQSNKILCICIIGNYVFIHLPKYTTISSAAQAFKNTGSEQTISGLPLTADQLFYVAWAQVTRHVLIARAMYCAFDVYWCRLLYVHACSEISSMVTTCLCKIGLETSSTSMIM